MLVITNYIQMKLDVSETGILIVYFYFKKSVIFLLGSESESFIIVQF